MSERDELIEMIMSVKDVREIIRGILANLSDELLDRLIMEINFSK